MIDQTEDDALPPGQIGLAGQIQCPGAVLRRMISRATHGGLRWERMEHGSASGSGTGRRWMRGPRRHHGSKTSQSRKSSTTIAIVSLR